MIVPYYIQGYGTDEKSIEPFCTLEYILISQKGVSRTFRSQANNPTRPTSKAYKNIFISKNI